MLLVPCHPDAQDSVKQPNVQLSACITQVLALPKLGALPDFRSR